MNTHTKGRLNENKIRKHYENNGYIMYRPPSTKYGEQDIFGHWDLLGMNRDVSKLIQVKSNMTDVSKFKKKSEKWCALNCLERDGHNPNYLFDYELFAVLPKGKIRKWRWCPFLLKWYEELDLNKFYE